MFVRRGLPLPVPGNSLESRSPGTNSEHIAVGSGQIFGRWYIGILNNESTAVNYRLCVSEVTNYTRLTNDVESCATNTLLPDFPHYFRVTIGPNAESAEFSVDASGDVDLYVRRTPPAGEFVYDYASEVLGDGTEAVTVAFDSLPVPLRPGDWYVAVVSRETEAVSYCMRVSEFDPSLIKLYITNGFEMIPRYMDLTWIGPEFLSYRLEYTDSLGTPNWQPVTDASGAPLVFGPGQRTHTFRDTRLFIDPPGPGLVRMRWYRVLVQ
jgi:hypothetical protein